MISCFFPACHVLHANHPIQKNEAKLHLYQGLCMWTQLLWNIFRVNRKAPAVLSLSSLSVLLSLSLSVVFAVAEGGVGSLPGIGALSVWVSSMPIFAVLMVARWVMSVRAVAVSAAVVLLWLLYPLNICKNNSIQCYTEEQKCGMIPTPLKLQQQQIFNSYCDVDPRETLSVVD